MCPSRLPAASPAASVRVTAVGLRRGDLQQLHPRLRVSDRGDAAPPQTERRPACAGRCYGRERQSCHPRTRRGLRL
jgi:hypothetical protein